jgi:hypothetical protein
LKFAAGVARVFAVLIVIGTSLGAAASLAGIGGITPGGATVPVAVPGGLAVLFLVIGVIYAVLFWAGADALVMVADSDDAHRLTQFQLARLSAQIATLHAAPGGPPSSDATERLT